LGLRARLLTSDLYLELLGAVTLSSREEMKGADAQAPYRLRFKGELNDLDLVTAAAVISGGFHPSDDTPASQIGGFYVPSSARVSADANLSINPLAQADLLSIDGQLDAGFS